MMSGMGDLSKMAKMMTPEQAIDLYKANAKLALDVINAAIENTTKLRRLQFEGEEEARAMGRKAAKRAAEAGTPNEMMAAGQTASQEAVEHAMHYWGQMFEMIAEMQKRLFVMMEEQMAGVPGVKEAKAAMSMMPDLRQAQNVITGDAGRGFVGRQHVRVDAARDGRLCEVRAWNEKVTRANCGRGASQRSRNLRPMTVSAESFGRPRAFRVETPRSASLIIDSRCAAQSREARASAGV